MTRSTLLLLLAGALAATLPACIQLPPAVADELRPAVPSHFGAPAAPPQPATGPGEDPGP